MLSSRCVRAPAFRSKWVLRPNQIPIEKSPIDSSAQPDEAIKAKRKLFCFWMLGHESKQYAINLAQRQMDDSTALRDGNNGLLWNGHWLIFQRSNSIKQRVLLCEKSENHSGHISYCDPHFRTAASGAGFTVRNVWLEIFSSASVAGRTDKSANWIPTGFELISRCDGIIFLFLPQEQRRAAPARRSVMLNVKTGL